MVYFLGTIWLLSALLMVLSYWHMEASACEPLVSLLLDTPHVASMMTEPAVTSSLLEFLCCCCSLQSQNCGLWLQAIIVRSWCELTGWNLWARVVCFMHSQGMFHNTKSLGTVITRQHGITEKVIRCEIWTNWYPHMKACCMLSLVNAFCDALHLMDDYTDLWLRYTYCGSVWFLALPMACTDTFLISWHTDL